MSHPDLQPELAAGAAALYTQLVQPQKGTRSSFLSSLLRRFDTAACLVTRDAATDLECVTAPDEFPPFGRASLYCCHC